MKELFVSILMGFQFGRGVTLAVRGDAVGAGMWLGGFMFLVWLAVLPARMDDPAFRRQQAERITDAVLAIYQLAKAELTPPRKITSGLHRADHVIGSIGL